MNRLNVLLIENEPNITLLEAELKEAGFIYLKTPYDSTFLTLVKAIAPNVIIFKLDIPTNALFADLQTLNHQSALPIIMFTRDDQAGTINLAIKADVCALIVGDFEPKRLNSIIKVAIARFKHQQALKTALEEARAKLEDRKVTDQAKAILIKTQNFSEDEAYHTLRKLAMDRKITLGEMAKNVIAMSDLFK
jgi:response regulator NasT